MRTRESPHASRSARDCTRLTPSEHWPERRSAGINGWYPIADERARRGSEDRVPLVIPTYPRPFDSNLDCRSKCGIGR